MISITCEASLPSKIKAHIKKNWPVYAMGAGAVATGIAAGELADRIIKPEGGVKDAITAARTAGILGTGWAMKKKHVELNTPNKKKQLNEFEFKDTKTADVIEKTGGKPAVGHLRKHWKKYAALAGAGVAMSLAGEGERIAAHNAIRNAHEGGNLDIAKKASDRLRRAEYLDNLGTATTIAGGSLAASGKLFSKRKGNKK